MGERIEGAAMPKRGPRNYVNMGRSEDLPRGAPIDAVKTDFAHRLYQAMLVKGWNQSELARQMSSKLGKIVPRDNVSNWIRGVVLPTGERLIALAEVLGKKPDELVVAMGRPSAESKNPPYDLRALDDGKTSWLKVNRRVSRELGHKIVGMLEAEKETE